MALDYSKWDKLELSDDSDIEGHPNVDKASLIRWKQQDIRAKRQQRAFREQQLRVNIETNTELLARIDAIKGRGLAQIPACVAAAAAGRPAEKPTLSTAPDQPRYDDMIESLLEQIKGSPGALEGHRAMIQGALADEKKELAGIEFEKNQHITADDLRDGWNSTVMNKGAAGAAGAAAGAKEARPQAPHAPAERAPERAPERTPERAPAPPSSDEIDPLHPDTRKFGTLPSSNLEISGSYLVSHPHIISENQKDALIMTAFDAQLAGDAAGAENIVHQALLLQYSAILGGVDGARRFLTRIADKKHPAAVGFYEEVASTTKHIQSRCEVLAKEQEPVEQIQLHAVDPNTEILVQVPKEDAENYALYAAFPQPLKDAIASRSLDNINALLAEMSLEEAEHTVAQLSESGVLLVEEKIYNADEWDQHRANELANEPAAGSIDDLD